jgi:hypothetical protein
MSADIAELILQKAVDLHNKEKEYKRIIITITHNYLDENSVSKSFYVHPRQHQDEMFFCIEYNGSILKTEHFDDNSLVLNVILQSILTDFIEISCKEHDRSSFEADLDWVEIVVKRDDISLGKGAFYFRHDVGRQEVQDICSCNNPERHIHELYTVVGIYTRYAMSLR